MNLNKKYLTKTHAVEVIKETIAELSDVVGATMGPHGNKAIIPDNSEYGKFIVTKDGVSVAKAFTTDNTFKNVLVKLARQVAEETVEEAGDGTTTSIVLMDEFVKNLQVPYFKEYDKIIENIITKLNAKTKKITADDIYKVCMVSANGDDVISRNISSVFTSIDSDVTVKKGHATDDVLTSNKGYFIPQGLFEDQYKLFRGVINISKDVPVAVLEFDLTVPSLSKIENFIMMAKHNGGGLIITPNLDRNVLKIFEKNKVDIVVVKAPGFGDHRNNLLSDIANYCGADSMTLFEESFTKKHLGSASFSIDKDVTTIKNNNSEKAELAKQTIKSLLEDNNLEEYSRDLLVQRLNRLNGEIATIYVGGHSEAEQKERFDRYEDAILAVKCALAEGVIKGGGVTLYEIANELEGNDTTAESHIIKVLRVPYIKLSNNGEHYQLNTLDDDIVDPVKVTKTALIKAYNFAKLMLTTDSIILGNYEE